MHDIAIIGAGPAGLSAAITARARDKKVLVISNKPQESRLAKSKLIENYPGLPRVSGLHLLEQMISQARDLGVEFLYERAISVLPMGERFAIATGSTNTDVRSVILATGAHIAKPFAGEAEFLGRGVSYCATCDGMLYRTATVCVVGLSAEAVEEANFLAGIGAKVIFLAKKIPHGLNENIMVEEGTVAEIKGDTMSVTALDFKASGTDKIESILCSGVFILRPSIAPDALITGLDLADGHIMVDGAMSTSITGIFAAGDCVGKPLQIAKAVGEGQCACFSATEYLDRE
ncbi:MAG: NAD(P)/FAD-dependent oxidoreductase [Coriobacteriales bacterium]|jgi:thioredoxin reductase (NADPH)|nr:NAD(P)/FAD-dependent oxidoreductase [Coriobacteriales bacterium]